MSEKNSFESFFDDLSEEKPDENGVEKVEEIAPKITPKEMLVDPETPPPSPVEIKKFEDSTSEFDKMVEICREGVESLILGEEEYKKFQNNFNVKRVIFKEDSSPNELSRQLCCIQIMKDDLVELIAEAHGNYLRRKRYTDILLNSFNSISQQKTADKRKGDANLKLFDFIKGCSDAEVFYTKCRYFYDNLESQHKTISRRITCMQAQVNLREINPISEDSQIELKDETSPGEVGWER